MDGGISRIGSSELIHFLTSAKYRSSRDQRRKWWRWPLTAPSEPHGGRWTSCNERRKEKRGDDARNRRPEDPTGRGRSPLLELSCPAEHRRQGDRGWLAESSSFSSAFFPYYNYLEALRWWGSIENVDSAFAASVIGDHPDDSEDSKEVENFERRIALRYEFVVRAGYRQEREGVLRDHWRVDHLNHANFKCSSLSSALYIQ